MAIRIIACGIFAEELAAVLTELKEEGRIAGEILTTTVPAGLHVDYDGLKAGVNGALGQAGEEKKILLYGTMCHPDIAGFAKEYDAVMPLPGNCIEMFLPKEEQGAAGKWIFYMTAGWLRHWREILFARGADEVDVRQSFGLYEKLVLLDSGTVAFTDEDLLALFEIVQVPIEVRPIDLGAFKAHVAQAIVAAGARA